MTNQEFMEIYDQSVYQVRLSAALRLLGHLDNVNALEMADEFVRVLKSESKKALQAEYEEI